MDGTSSSRAQSPQDDDLSEVVRHTTQAFMAVKDPAKIKVDFDRFTTAEAVWEALDGDPAPVVLISGKWLMAFAQTGVRLPRRQDLAEEAFLSLAALQRIRSTAKPDPLNKLKNWGQSETLPILAISYCWFTALHPDPDGVQLKFIVGIMEEQFGPGHGLWPWHEDCAGYGGIYEDMGIFWDWCSLHQKDAAGKRTPTERACFDKALTTMGLWYCHPMTVVYLVTPQFEPSVDYSKRGWTCFERSLTELAKPSTASLRGKCSWAMCIDVQIHADGRGPGRHSPLAPALFVNELQMRTFTNRGDKAVVAKLYTETALCLLRGIQHFSICNSPLGVGAGARLAAVLPFCCSMESLNLGRCELEDADLAEIAPVLPQCEALLVCVFSQNCFTDASVLVDVLPKCPSLTQIVFLDNPIDPAKMAVAKAAAEKANVKIHTDVHRMQKERAERNGSNQ